MDTIWSQIKDWGGAMNQKTAKRPNSYGLRLSDDLKAELKGKAAESQRSLNAEIIYRLTQSLTKQSI